MKFGDDNITMTNIKVEYNYIQFILKLFTLFIVRTKGVVQEDGKRVIYPSKLYLSSQEKYSFMQLLSTLTKQKINMKNMTEEQKFDFFLKIMLEVSDMDETTFKKLYNLYQEGRLAIKQDDVIERKNNKKKQ